MIDPAPFYFPARPFPLIGERVEGRKNRPINHYPDTMKLTIKDLERRLATLDTGFFSVKENADAHYMKRHPITPATVRRVFPRVPETLARSTRQLIAVITAGIEI